MDFKNTLNLPKTDFPMKADLPAKEQGYLAVWDREDLYEKMKTASEGRPLFVLHDGPPYANGHLHMGHAMNKILKDIINRVSLKKGRAISYVPGWDCHGLPIEHKVLKDMGKKRSDLSALEIRKKCRESATLYSDIQKKEFIRMGILGDFQNPYLTMDYSYEAEILRALGRMNDQGRIYKGEKPVLWCGTCETALADAEVEYAPHRSQSVTVLFEGEATGRKTYYPIWTTTPWTLPANQAVAVNPEVRYSLFELTHDTLNLEKGAVLVLAEAIADRLAQEGNSPWKEVLKASRRIGTRTGADLLKEKPSLRHPFIPGKIVPLVAGSFVQTDQGTGLVHIAPGHGEEDFEVGRTEGLSSETPVNGKGRYGASIASIDPSWAGLRILEAGPQVIILLERTRALLHQEILEHSYPHCWRCKNPVYYRATSQWFLSLEAKELRERTLASIGEVQWIPEKGENRIRGMIETRPDWCLSRQRSWGVPIPAYSCNQCGKSTLDSDFINTIADRTEREGVDFWFDPEVKERLLQNLACPACKSKDLTLEEDILDVWFDSGISHEAVLKKRPDLAWPADLYLEGSDQHRGWFHSSLLTSMALEGRPPYRSVLTHGFVVDGQGKKMAKTLGNVIAPSEIIEKYGADVLRLWVAASDYQEDTRLSMEIMNNLVDGYRKIRNTFRYMLSNLYDYPGGRTHAPSRDILDRWILSVWEGTKASILEAYDQRKFAQIIQSLNHFCSLSLSAHYFDMVKDRLYADRADGETRRQTQATMARILEELASVLHPVLPFTTTEILLHASGKSPDKILDASMAILMAPFPERDPSRIDPELESQIERLLGLRTVFGRMTDDLKKEKRIGSTLEIHLRMTGDRSRYNPGNWPDDFFETFFIVSKFSWKDAGSMEDPAAVLATAEGPEPGTILVLHPAPGIKCERCWLRKTTTGKNPEGNPVCDRCHKSLQSPV
ncbi:MAG: isoleucine--tRNA ligase [Nitrospirae bacterium]|nr:isoleucine--tRNA ligase [Nitrospirota bacterium]MCL5285258.1 isoleucine--tRNA ligase [Nitrospirota bacterium]